MAIAITESQAACCGWENELQHVARFLNAIGGRRPETIEGCKQDCGNENGEDFVLPFACHDCAHGGKS
jgi:hypothetical protein